MDTIHFCDFYVKKGYCSRPKDGLIGDYMQRNCPLSCKFCEKGWRSFSASLLLLSYFYFHASLSDSFHISFFSFLFHAFLSVHLPVCIRTYEHVALLRIFVFVSSAIFTFLDSYTLLACTSSRLHCFRRSHTATSSNETSSDRYVEVKLYTMLPLTRFHFGNDG